MVYVDNVIIFSQTAKEYLEHIKEILRRLHKHGLYIKPKKCKFGEEEIAYLGHIINCDRMHIDPIKIKTLAVYPVPTSITEAQAFMELAFYYRRFICRFSHVASPNYDLFRKEVRFQWTQQQQYTFDKLKTRLTQAPILRRPNWIQKFIL